MTKRLLVTTLAAVALAAAAQPKPKSNEEIKALNALFSAPDPDSRIKAGDDALTNFPKTEFKSVILFTMADSYNRKNDYAKMVVYGERALEADPTNVNASLLLAQGIARQVKENDLDHDERLNQAEKYAKESLQNIPAMEKPNTQATDDQWAAEKKNMTAEAHEDLGIIAASRKKFDVAADEYKLAVDTAATPSPTAMVRLAQTYNKTGKFDDAIALTEKVMATPDLNAQVKQFAQAERVRAFQGKQAAK